MGKVPGTHKALTLVGKRSPNTTLWDTLGNTVQRHLMALAQVQQEWQVQAHHQCRTCLQNCVTHCTLLLPAQNPVIYLKCELSGIGSNAGSRIGSRAGSCWSQTDKSRVSWVSELHCLLHKDHSRTRPQLHISYHTDNYLNVLRQLWYFIGLVWS